MLVPSRAPRAQPTSTLVDALISAFTVNQFRLGGLSGFRLLGFLRLEQRHTFTFTIPITLATSFLRRNGTVPRTVSTACKLQPLD